jgi:exosome complex exonuclease RRP6
VNLFDTGQAARALQLPSAGLAHLLEQLCSVRADKRFQLADWRLRPLTDDMAHYARSDTHYLLYCYDVLRGMLRRAPPPPPLPTPEQEAAARAAAAAAGGGERARGAVGAAAYAYVPEGLEPGGAGGDVALGALPAVWARSAAVCLRTYRKETPREDAAAAMADRAGEPLGAAGLAVLRALLTWRDAAARAADESTGYVLSKAVALRLAKAAAASAEAAEPRTVAAVCGREALFAAARAVELAAVISRAKAAADARALREQQEAQRQRQQAQAAAAPAGAAVPLALEPDAEAEGPPRKRRAIAMGFAAQPARPSGLGALLESGAGAPAAPAAPVPAAEAQPEDAADAAARVRASLALPF